MYCNLKHRDTWLGCERVALAGELCHLVGKRLQVFRGISKKPICSSVWFLQPWLPLTCSSSSPFLRFTDCFISPSHTPLIPQRPAVPGTFGPLRGSDPTKLYGSPRVPEPHPGDPVQQHQHFAMQVRNAATKGFSTSGPAGLHRSLLGVTALAETYPASLSLSLSPHLLPSRPSD